MKTCLLVLFTVLALTCGTAGSVQGVSWTSTPSFEKAAAPERTTVVISDLHLGLGRNADGEWHSSEDFRWSKALKVFLDEISEVDNPQIDLVIAGDFLELWQTPDTIRCEGIGAELGCTLDEMNALTTMITRAHAQEFNDLREFSLRGENRLHIIPGNHDSALLVAAVWEPVGKALGAESGRVNFAGSGVWVTDDGSTVIEHGHQIGSDANRYDTWPNIVRTQGGIEYIMRPWGEQFVQKVFNEQERQYSIIDNLSPESAGIRYRIADRGARGTAADIAQFVAFNLFQTSLRQKVQILGAGDSPDGIPEWDITKARGMGHGLFLAALPPSDELRAVLLRDSDEAREVRLELDALAKDDRRLPLGDVKMLCELAEIRGNSVCLLSELGATVERVLVPREWVLESHVRLREAMFPKMRTLIYGHTHQLEVPWQVGQASSVRVVNSGAFHRLIDEEGFLLLLKGISPEEGLKKFSVEELPPCYTFVLIAYGREPEVKRLSIEESQGIAKIVEPGSSACR